MRRLLVEDDFRLVILKNHEDFQSIQSRKEEVLNHLKGEDIMNTQVKQLIKDTLISLKRDIYIEGNKDKLAFDAEKATEKWLKDLEDKEEK